MTSYPDGDHGITQHSDKVDDIYRPSYIVVFKLGPCARNFRIEGTEDTTLVYDMEIPPGSAIFMSTHANSQFKHGVPAGNYGPSGSIVGRHITSSYSREEIATEIANSEQKRQERKQKKADGKQATTKKTSSSTPSVPGDPSGSSVSSLGLSQLNVGDPDPSGSSVSSLGLGQLTVDSPTQSVSLLADHAAMDDEAGSLKDFVVSSDELTVDEEYAPGDTPTDEDDGYADMEY